MIDFGYGAIWDCDNVLTGSTSPKALYGDDVSLCANEGDGSCKGPGYVFYGAHLTWTFKRIGIDESISCSNSDFGCDPLLAFTKQCYILPENIVTIDPKCPFNVLSIDHNSGINGKYFNFDIEIVNNILGNTFETGNYMIFNKRTKSIRLTRMWSYENGGSNGDGHGRYHPLSIAQQGDWQQNDILHFATLESKYFECTDWPAPSSQGSNRCNDGNAINDGYYYIYNEHRGTDLAECGKDANCWCCRSVIPEFC